MNLATPMKVIGGHDPHQKEVVSVFFRIAPPHPTGIIGKVNFELSHGSQQAKQWSRGGITLRVSREPVVREFL